MTHDTKQIIITVACLAGAAGLLTACSSNTAAEGGHDTASPTTGPTPSITASASRPMTSAPPKRPTAAEGLTLAAAEAFYRHYVDPMNHAAKTGDTTALLAASESGCEHCTEYANFVAKTNEANGGLNGDYYERVKEVSDLIQGSSSRVGGSAIVTVGNYTTKESPTAKPIVSKQAEYTEQIALSPSGGNWVMYELKLIPR